MRRIIAAFLAAAGASSTASAVVNTSIVFQVSSDGVNWSTRVEPIPGQTISVRALVSYTGTAAPIGLASLVFQPTMSNALSTDVVAPFINGGVGSNTSTPPGVIQPSDTVNFGRVSPWGRSATSSTSALRGFFHTNPVGDGVNYLRIAQSQVTSWIGGQGNTSGGSGVNIAQLSDVGRTTSDPAFNSSLSNIYIFKWGVTVGAGHFEDMVIDAPLGGFGNVNTTTFDREVYWFANMNEATGSIRGTATVTTAVIGIPAPTPLALLGLGGLLAGRRRRRFSTSRQSAPPRSP